MSKKSDYLIIGAGIIGINIARAIKEKYPAATITILEKENSLANHGSGRNSGVLHSGFYYKPNTLKAKFTRLGNIAMTEYCNKHNLQINKCGKVVVTQNEAELVTLVELFNRGKANNSGLIMIDQKELKDIEPYAVTYKQAIYSPYTSTVNPKEILLHMAWSLQLLSGIEIITGEGYKSYLGNNVIVTTKNKYIEAKFIINAAGLYADKIAKDFGFSNNYTIIPFKGIYLKAHDTNIKIKRNIYPVPKRVS